MTDTQMQQGKNGEALRELTMQMARVATMVVNGPHTFDAGQCAALAAIAVIARQTARRAGYAYRDEQSGGGALRVAIEEVLR